MASRQIHAYEFGPFCIDMASRVLLREGKPIPLEPKVFDTLLALVENHARVVSKEELMDAVWGPDTFVEEGSLTRNISLLRKTIAEGLEDTLCIATFPKRGYQFVARVSTLVGTSHPMAGTRAPGRAPAALDNGHPRRAPVQTDDRGRRGFAEIVRGHPLAVLAATVAVLALALGYWFVRPLPAPVARSHQALTHDARQKRGPLLTDGPRLYFEEMVDGKWMLAVVPTVGADLSPFPLPFSDVRISDIGRDGSDLLGWEKEPGSPAGKLLVWPVVNGAPEVLADLRGLDPVWSPDRAKIAYNDGLHSIFVAGRHGEDSRKVASVAGAPLELQWSPDGKSLRFFQRDSRSEVGSLWEVAAQGGQPHPLLTGWKYSAFDPIWTADGNYCLFASGPPGAADIWVRREDCNPFRWRCREPIRITAGLGDSFAPLPSHDGRKLFFINSQSSNELTRFDLKSRTFAPYLPGLLAADLDFSPGADWVAYARLPERTLWRSRVDGSNATPLTASGWQVFSPYWSPDGKQIAYMAISAQKQYKAFVVSADGGEPHQLLPGAGEEGNPTWSRGGNLLAFGDVLHGRHASEMAIHLLDLRTHQVSILPGSQGLWTPRWSPDGRYIAALALGDEAARELADCPAILLYDFRTSRWTTLATIPSIANLAWSRDSQYLYFLGGSDKEMYRAYIGGKRVERLVSLKDIPPIENDWIGVAPDGSPLTMKGIRIQGVYALDVQWH